MQLARLVQQVERVRASRGKLEKVALLAELLKDAQGRELGLVTLYLCGTLPQGRIGIGWKAIEAALPTGPAKGAPLCLLEIDETLRALGAEAGPGSAGRRAIRLGELLSRALPEERSFLVQLLLGEVRQGALDGLVLEAIARAAGLPPAEVRQAAMFAPSLADVARAALEAGTAGLARFTLRVLQPVAPMLASPVSGPAEALERLGAAAFEFKLDGARVQIHKAGDEVRVFTRQLQDVSARVPELVEWARERPVTELVVEGETLALRPDGRPHPFQVSMRRLGRSREIGAARATLPLSLFLFDCLFVAGEGSLVGLGYAERYERLRALASDRLLPRIVTTDPDEAARFMKRALDEGHEGLMAKALDSPYTAGQRGFHWLKLKSATTLDLVVLAAEWGSGRRKGLLSNLHLGARDAGSGGFVMLGKTFKGLTDALLAWQTQELLAREERRDAMTVYVRPELVVEIAFGDVQESPRYPAGLALRFARVKRYRDDKRADAADTIETLREIHRRQRA